MRGLLAWRTSETWPYALALIGGPPKDVFFVIDCIYAHMGGTDESAALGVVTQLLQFLIEDGLIEYERGTVRLITEQ